MGQATGCPVGGSVVPAQGGQAFSENWEYYVPDPEVLQIIEDSFRGIVGDEFYRRRDGEVSPVEANPGFALEQGQWGKRRASRRHTMQVVFTYLYCCTKFNRADIAYRLGVSVKTLNNWKKSLGLSGRNRRAS